MAVAGALEMKVWIKNKTRTTYPTLYTILCAPPGVGKSIVLNEIADMWRKLEGHHVAPSSVTKAALIDSLNDAGRVIQRPTDLVNPFYKFNSLKLASSELGVLIPQYDGEFMSVLTDLYDGQPYAERRRTNDRNLKIERPQLTLFGATTPSYFAATIPEGAWDGGFISRCFLVFTGTSPRQDLFDDAGFTDERMYDNLVGDLRRISGLFGPVSVEDEVKEAVNEWWKAGAPPCPDHPKMKSYLERRGLHIMKLFMVAMASRGEDMTIRLEDFHRALEWLVEMEVNIPDLFRSMGGSTGDGRAIEECWHYAFTTYAKRPRPIPERELYAFLAERVPSYSVGRMIEVMEKSGYILREIDPKDAKIGYVPLNRRKTG